MTAIFFHHLWLGIARPVADNAFEIILNAVFKEAALGVVFFNLLSGFLLALPYLGADGRPLDKYTDFIRHKFLRIVPHYYLTVLVIFVGNIVFYGADPLSSAASFLKFFIFVQSWQSSIFYTNYAALWYLGLLAQFYLVFPFILRLFCRIGAGKALILLVVLSYGGCGLLEAYVSTSPGSLFGGMAYMMPFNLPSRLPEFALGMWFAAAWKKHGGLTRQILLDSQFLKIFLSMVLFATGLTIFYHDPPFPVSLMKQVAWCFLIFSALFMWGKAAELGNLRLVKSFSAASYSFYLLHQPLLSYFQLLVPGGFGRIGEFLFLAAISVPVICCCSFILDRIANWSLGRIMNETANIRSH